MKVIAAACVAAGAGVVSAFQPSFFGVQQQLASSRSTASHAATTTMMAAMSKSIPFIEKPKNLDGSMPGDNGFDPLLFSDSMNMSHMQAVELKHSRISMLAVVGFLAVSAGIHLPWGDYPVTSNPFEALKAIPLASHLQTLLVISVFEAGSIAKVYSDGSEDAWERLQQDPKAASAFYAKGKDEQAKAKLQEIKNGRLAMFAIIGLFVQTALGRGIAP